MSGLEKMLSLRVVELLNSRLCHDLISPVGAVKSGLELLAEFSDDPGGEAMALITNSADSASRKLQFFRMAFGMAGSAQSLSHAEAVDLCTAMVVSRRTRLDWPDSGQQAGADIMKIALNMVLLAAEALPRGGDLQVKVGVPGDDCPVTILAAASDANLSDEIKAAALGQAEESELTPRSVQAYLAYLLAVRHGSQLTIEEKTGAGIQFSVRGATRI